MKYLLSIYSSLNSVANEYIRNLESRGRSYNSIQIFKRHYENYISPELGTREISCIRQSDIESFKAKLSEKKNISSSTFRTVMIHLKSVLTFAYSNHLLPDNPSNYIAIKVDRRHQLRQFSEDECKMLLMSFDSVYLRNLYRFVYFSGISIRESAALHLSDYHPDSRTLDVSHVLNYRQNKDVYIGPNKMPRQIIIPSEAAVCIEDELENRAQKSIAEEASNLIFTERSGNIINMRNFIYCNGVIKKKSAVNDFRPLYLRDNFLLRCLNEGVDDRSLERYLGICSNTYMLYIQNLFQPIRRPGIDIYS